MKKNKVKTITFRPDPDVLEMLASLTKVRKRSEAINRALRDTLGDVLKRLQEAEAVASGKQRSGGKGQQRLSVNTVNNS